MALQKRIRLSRAESQAQTRERLIEAARQEIARRGSAASVRDIAEAAGYTQGALYAHFQSKELLLLELLRQHMDREIATLEQLLAVSDGGLRARVEQWLGALNTDRDWSMLAIELQMHASRDAAFRERYDALFERHRAAMGRLVGQLFDELGRVPPAPPEEVATALMALAHGLALQRRPTRRGEADPSGALIGLVLNGLIAASRQKT